MIMEMHPAVEKANLAFYIQLVHLIIDMLLSRILQHIPRSQGLVLRLKETRISSC